MKVYYSKTNARLAELAQRLAKNSKGYTIELAEYLPAGPQPEPRQLKQAA